MNACAVRQVGEGEFLDRWEPGRPLARRQGFVLRLLRHVLQVCMIPIALLETSRYCGCAWSNFAHAVIIDNLRATYMTLGAGALLHAQPPAPASERWAVQRRAQPQR